MAYFFLKVDNTKSTTTGSTIGTALKVIENCMVGSHTSASTLGTLSGEGSDLWDASNSLVINDSAHRQTKHSGPLYSTSSSTTSANAVYHLKSNSYGTSSYAYFDFYKRHYMNNRISGASTTTSFQAYVHFRIGWSSTTGWWVGIADRSGSNHMPVSSSATSTGAQWTANGSNHEVGSGNWKNTDYIQIWMGETYFGFSAHHYVGTSSYSYNTRNSGKNVFTYWGDFPYIDSVDGYHYGRNSNYYPGCMMNVGMHAHDVRLKNTSPDTSDYGEFQLRRYGAVTGLNEYFTPPQSHHTNYLYGGIGGLGYQYAQYPTMSPWPMSPRTPIPTANGTGPIMIPCQYLAAPFGGRDEATTTPTNAGTQAGSAANFGDTRAGQMLGLYQVPDEFGNKPGDRFKVGDEFYRTVWTHKKGGYNGGFLNADNSETAVYALPEKSVVGPDAI